jgi:phytoene dehydrogenase-like protein
MMASSGLQIAIVGAGLAGLVCARRLVQAGRRVLVLEREERVGGRVRTTVSPDGYRLDRGFQVIFAAYPALLRHVTLTSLSPRYFSSSTAVVRDGRMLTVGHPLYDPRSLPATLRSGLVHPRDLVAMTALLWQARSFGDAPLPDSDRSTRDVLQRAGASEHLIDDVLVPFYGGVSFDRSLSSDASFFGLVLRSLAIGRSFLPALGMQQLPEMLARDLPGDALRLGTEVERLSVEAGAVRGVVTSEGRIDAQAVVVAAEAPVAARLTGQDTPSGQRSGTTVYFASDRPLYTGKRTVVHAEESLVNEVVQLTNVAPEYAPPGRHLLCANVLHTMEGRDEAIARAVQDDLRSWLPGADRTPLEVVDVVRVPYAQFAQPPGIYGRLPGPRTRTRGLYLAGEYLHSSSIQGAMRGGEMAAAAVLSTIQ